MFQHSPAELSELCARVLQIARNKGATAAEADLSESLGQNVQVRMQQIDQIEFQQDNSLDVTVYVGHQKGRASTADFSPQALDATVQAALDIARYTCADPYAGLADAGLMAHEFNDLDKYHEWDLSGEAAIELAKRCEAAAFAADSRITKAGGTGVQTNHYQYVYGNSHGFLQHQKGTRHSLFCSMIGEENGNMEASDWYDYACDAQDLETPEQIGLTAGKRTVSHLGGRSIPTGNYPVLFDNTVSGSLINHIVGGLSGSSLYRQSSFLLDSLGKQILPEFLSLREEPHIPRLFGSTYFDSEGVATRPRFVIENGMVAGYFLGSYSARKLGMTSTANAGGAHNLQLSHTHAGQTDLLRQMGTGLLVTDLMGQGINMLTGDYSRGASGFWVENGIIAYPVNEITIAGRLQDMLKNIVGVADDSLRRSSNKIGSILIEEMTVAGI